jgi:hypothetical protein
MSDYVRPLGPWASWIRDERNAYYRWKYATDADYRKRRLQSALEYGNARYANDPDWRQAKLQVNLDKYANDPEFRQARLQRENERYANDPEFRQAKLQRERERYANNPEFQARVKQRARESYLRKKSELAVDKDKSDSQKMSIPQDKLDGPAIQP